MTSFFKNVGFAAPIAGAVRAEMKANVLPNPEKEAIRQNALSALAGIVESYPATAVVKVSAGVWRDDRNIFRGDVLNFEVTRVEDFLSELPGADATEEQLGIKTTETGAVLAPAYVRVDSGAVDQSSEVAPGVVVDTDIKGNVVGVEVLDAAPQTETAAAADVPAQEPPAAEPNPQYRPA